MFNLGNIIKAVVTIAAVANTVIRKVAEKNPVVANVVQRFDNFVSSFTGGGGSSGGSSSGSGGLSAAERQRREEERRQRELDRRASAFDDDIARKLSDQRPDVEADGDGGGNQAVPSLRDLAAMTGLDLDRWIQGEPMSAELTILATESAVAFTTLQILRHEPQLLQMMASHAPTVEHALVALIAGAEANSVEVEQSAKIVKTWDLHKTNVLADDQMKQATEVGISSKHRANHQVNIDVAENSSIPIPIATRLADELPTSLLPWISALQFGVQGFLKSLTDERIDSSNRLQAAFDAALQESVGGYQYGLGTAKSQSNENQFNTQRATLTDADIALAAMISWHESSEGEYGAAFDLMMPWVPYNYLGESYMTGTP